MPQQRIGIIGLGLMGHAFAKRFIAAGYSVTGFDVSPAARDAAQSAGVRISPSAPDVFASSDVVVLSLPTSDVVEHVLAESASHLRPDHILLDTTTGDPDVMQQIGERLAKQNVHYLDATVAANSVQVLAGEGMVMAGGDPAAFDACRRLLATFAPEGGSFHLGPCGSGARMKLVVNLMLGLSRAALAESISFAGKMGLDSRRALEVLTASNAYSRVMDTKGEKMLTADFTPQGRLSQHLKDVRLILELAARTAARVPLSQTHQQLLERCEAMGLGQMDNSAVIRAYESGKEI
jgi:3-hydroxyisobutyrate dehydrogenase-like beta-hydroxyacid dehydrogenase